MDYSKLLIQIRAYLNLSQKDLGNLLGVSFSTINRWENKKCQPTKKHIYVLKTIADKNNIENEEDK